MFYRIISCFSYPARRPARSASGLFPFSLHFRRILFSQQIHFFTKETDSTSSSLLGGGGILFDESSAGFLRDVNWAKDLQTPVMTYAIGVGPLKTPESKQLVVEALNKVEKITMREGEKNFT
jgi:polysaccharide pyruvyl transferase WcaK-like protein